MRIVKLKIENFRGIKHSELTLQNQCVIVGDNNTGKSTILEAIDLVLGPERMSKYPVIDEHDFFAGNYLSTSDSETAIGVEVIIVDLNDDQKTRFWDQIEWYNLKTNSLVNGPPVEQTDEENVKAALRVCFKGWYNEEEDDFTGETYFCSPVNEDGSLERFHKSDKRECGFLFLRTLRTGSRALSLEKGSLLDIILRLRELRPKMWEDVLTHLRTIAVAEDSESGITDVLVEVQEAVRSFIPSDWVEDPRLKVSTLTRMELRRVLTVFMGTGAIGEEGSEYSAPFQHQGTGTINTLVLSLLVMIAELKKNVIFAMEEPEIAIPPHAQKRIINSVISKAAQSIFTSHSPYVMEEFKPSQILVVKREAGELTGVQATYPPTIKPKRYQEEFRRRFCEALLARRVLIVEGRTEFDAIPVAARRLNHKKPSKYNTLEALGVAIINAETDSQVEPLGTFFKSLGKTVYAIFDKQPEKVKKAIAASVDHAYEGPESSFEELILKHSDDEALKRFAYKLITDGEWPEYLKSKKPTEKSTLDEIKGALFEYFKNSKGAGSAADFLAQCNPKEIPKYIRQTVLSIKENVEGKTKREAHGDESTV